MHIASYGFDVIDKCNRNSYDLKLEVFVVSSEC